MYQFASPGGKHRAESREISYHVYLGKLPWEQMLGMDFSALCPMTYHSNHHNTSNLCLGLQRWLGIILIINKSLYLPCAIHCVKHFKYFFLLSSHNMMINRGLSFSWTIYKTLLYEVMQMERTLIPQADLGFTDRFICSHWYLFCFQVTTTIQWLFFPCSLLSIPVSHKIHTDLFREAALPCSLNFLFLSPTLNEYPYLQSGKHL